MELEKFHELRSNLIMIEAELDELMSDGGVGKKAKEKQWIELAAIVANMCGDYDDQLPVGSATNDVNNCHQPAYKTLYLLFERQVEQATWRSNGQAYFVEQWSTIGVSSHPQEINEGDEPGYAMPRVINCCLRGARKKIQRRVMEYDNEESDGEDEQLMYSMTGQTLEYLPFPIIIDHRF